jgi:hypothetical protein
MCELAFNAAGLTVVMISGVSRVEGGVRPARAAGAKGRKYGQKMDSFHLVVCLTTGPKPLSKRALQIARYRASSFR